MFMCNIYLTVVHLKKKKKSVTTRCAFFSFYRYRKGYKSRAIMVLLSLITVKRKPVIEVNLLYCS